MAKRKSGQLSINFADERFRKIIGLVLILLAFYLFVAFTSYIFTWKVDHATVAKISTDLLYQDIQVENWLGRLGAIAADSLVWWGFGIASYFLVIILYKVGITLMRRSPAAYILPIVQRNTLWMVLVSIAAAFFMQWSEFPWGGVFGQSIALYSQNLVGAAGTLALMITLMLGTLIWNNNPNFDDFSMRKLGFELKRALRDIREGNYGKAPAESMVEKRRAAKKKSIPTKLDGEKPIETDADGFDIVTASVDDAAEKSVEAESDAGSAPKTPEAVPTGGQLAFELPDKKAMLEEAKRKRAAAKAGLSAAELEINTPTPSEPILPEEAEQYKPPTELVQQDSDSVLSGEPFDPTLELSAYEFPHLQLLNDYDQSQFEIDRDELEENKNQIVQTLLHFKIEVDKIRATIGPTVTLYEIVPTPGVRISKIKNLEDDIALNLAALGIRIIAPIPGKGTIGIEVPNKNKQIVGIKEVLRSEKFRRSKMDLPIALGKTISNEVYVADLARMPHLLIAGATGQGKSVGINVILNSLLYRKHPAQVKIIMIDPKKVELFPYAHLANHFLGFLPDQDEPIVTDTTRVVQTLNSLTIEMESRYDLLKNAETRNINEYNEKFIARKLNPNNGHKFLPYIVLVIDEFADLIMTAGKEVELPLGRLAQLARAVGIHLIIATQRPSVNIITGVIKANFPARLAFKVASKIDSRTILDAGGAEQLIGRGDMLLSIGGDIVRLQCAFVDTPEVDKVITFIKNQPGFIQPFFLPEYHPDGDEKGSKAVDIKDLDSNFEDAARLVVETQHGSTSMIQRRMKLGYNRAGRIMDQMEGLGIVGPAQGSKPREVLFFSIDELEHFLTALKKKK